MDNIIITSTDSSYISELKTALGIEFQISVLGSLCYFLSLEIRRQST